MFEKRLFYNVDWAMLAAVLALCLIGLVQIYSATGESSRIWVTQIYGIVFGLIVGIVAKACPFSSSPSLWACS